MTKKHTGIKVDTNGSILFKDKEGRLTDILSASGVKATKERVGSSFEEVILHPVGHSFLYEDEPLFDTDYPHKCIDHDGSYSIHYGADYTDYYDEHGNFHCLYEPALQNDNGLCYYIHGELCEASEEDKDYYDEEDSHSAIPGIAHFERFRKCEGAVKMAESFSSRHPNSGSTMEYLEQSLRLWEEEE